MMLLRADPNNKSISMLSFPRDLITRSGAATPSTRSQRINQAYALCGSKGALDTVQKLTGLSVNYLITVNFRGFIEVVDRVGGVWVDVDRRYYNRNVGTAATNYAKHRPAARLPTAQEAGMPCHTSATGTPTVISSGSPGSSSSSRL